MIDTIWYYINNIHNNISIIIFYACIVIAIGWIIFQYYNVKKLKKVIKVQREDFDTKISIMLDNEERAFAFTLKTTIDLIENESLTKGMKHLKHMLLVYSKDYRNDI